MLAANKTRRSDNAKYQVLRKAESLAFVSPSPTYPFSFPLCDLLICEFNPLDAAFSLSETPEVCSESVTEAKVYTPLHKLGLYRGSRKVPQIAARSLSALAELIYQKVIRRKPVPFLRSESDLNNLGCYIVETLECGHKVEIHPSEIETLTARKRNCHECSGWFGELQLGERKAPKSVKGIVRKRKIAGESPWWVIVFATCLIVVGGLWLHARWPKSFFYSYPTNYLRVMQRLNDRDFMVQRVEAGLAQETTMMRFCSDYLPWFEGGHILQWIRYDDHGSCQSVGPGDRGFDILRDASGMPVLPPNCRFDQVNNHIVCQGGKPRF